MREIMALFAIPGAVVVARFALILIDAFHVAQQEVAAGNVAVLGEFIIIGLLAILAIELLTFANPAR